MSAGDYYIYRPGSPNFIDGTSANDFTNINTTPTITTTGNAIYDYADLNRAYKEAWMGGIRDTEAPRWMWPIQEKDYDSYQPPTRSIIEDPSPEQPAPPASKHGRKIRFAPQAKEA